MTDIHRELLAESFAVDLLTDWVPDAIGATDVLDALRHGELPPPQPMEAGQLQVAMAGGAKTVPVLDVSLRARLHRLVDDALARHTPQAGVFSYRSLDADYRSAYQARAERLRALASDPKYPLVLTSDVHRFSASLPLSTVLGQPWMTPMLATEIAAMTAVAGRCLLPGHAWANRIGTAVLFGVDEALATAVDQRWVRWADDIHVFVSNTDEAEQIRALLAVELSRLGLQLSAEKTQVRAASQVLSGPARDVSGEPREVWGRGVATGDLRALRYALPRLAAHQDPFALGDLLSMTANHPYLVPRAVAYLDHFAGTAAGVQVIGALLDRETTPATAARLLALAVRHSALIAAAPDSMLRAAGNAEAPAVRALAWRANIARGGNAAPPPPTQRLAAWMRAGGELDAHPPIVDTLL